MNQCPSCGGICKPSGCERADYVERKIGCVNHDCDKCKQAQKQKPVAWLYMEPTNPHLHVHYDDVDVAQFTNDEWFPVYKLPPQRQWVGLTDEEVFDVWLNEMPAPDKVFYQKLCRSVEAKLREKNAPTDSDV